MYNLKHQEPILAPYQDSRLHVIVYNFCKRASIIDITCAAQVEVNSNLVSNLQVLATNNHTLPLNWRIQD